MKKFNWMKHFPEYNHQADFNTNAKSIIHYLSKSNEFLKIMAQRIEEYDETLSLSLENIHTILNGYMEEWEQNLQDFPDDVKTLLEKWLDDGTLDHIINETILSWKADKEYVDELFHTITSQMENDLKIVRTVEGTEDYSDILNNAFQNHSNIIIKNGFYPVDIAKMEKLKSNSRITFEPNAKIKVLPNDLERAYLLDMQNVENIVIVGANLEGDKHEHTGTTGQWVHGINIIDSRNIELISPKCHQFWGDGIYIRGEKNILITDPFCDDNRRQGISLIYGENISIVRPICTNTSGQSPGAGMDIEPNNVGEHLKNVHIYDPYFYNNGRTADDTFDYGLVIALKRLYSETETTLVDVTIHNPILENNALSIEARKGIRGSIKVLRPIIKNASKSALTFASCDSEELSISVENPIIEDPNDFEIGQAETAAILFIERTDAVGFQGVRNVEVINPTITNTNKQCPGVNIFNLTQEVEENMSNCIVSTPTIRGNIAPTISRAVGGNITPIHKSFQVTYGENTPPTIFTSNRNIGGNLNNHNVVYRGTTSTYPKVYLSDDVPITKTNIRIENQAVNNGYTIEFETPKKVFPLTIDTVNGILLPNKHSWVSMEKISNNEFRIVGSSHDIQAHVE